MLSPDIRIGTMGFSYKDWLGNFYPQFCPQADFLRYYAFKFCTVEIDSTFYRTPSAQTVDKWAGETPDEFVFAAKFPQSVTHVGELSGRVDSALAFVEVMRRLKSKLGPLLLQFPYSFQPDQIDLLRGVIEALPQDVKIAVELRNKKWFGAELFKLLKDKGIALCLVEHPWAPRLNVQTADFHYIRLLGDRKEIESDFSYIRFDREKELGIWREVISDLSAGGSPVFVYFNNHFSGHSPTTAFRMIELLDSGHN